MALDAGFELTPDVIQMLQQYGCTKDIVRSGSRGRLNGKAIKRLSGNFSSDADEKLQIAFNYTVEQLHQELYDLFYAGLNEELLATDMSIEQDNVREQSFYALDLTFESGMVIPINLAHLGIKIKNAINDRLRENPDQCWLLDPRSPFFSESHYQWTRNIAAAEQALSLVRYSEDIKISLLKAVAPFLVSAVH